MTTQIKNNENKFLIFIDFLSFAFSKLLFSLLAVVIIETVFSVLLKLFIISDNALIFVFLAVFIFNIEYHLKNNKVTNEDLTFNALFKNILKSTINSIKYFSLSVFVMSATLYFFPNDLILYIEKIGSMTPEILKFLNG